MKISSLRPWIGATMVIGGVLAATWASGTEQVPPSLRTHGASLSTQASDTGRVMVRFKTGASVLPHRARVLASRFGADGPQAAKVLSARHAMSLVDGRMLDERTQVVMAAGMDSATLRARLQADPEVEAVWLDGRRHASATIPNDPLYAASTIPATTQHPQVQAGQWYLRPPASDTVSAIDAQSAWKITYGDPSIVVGDIDTGIRYDHPDLAPKALPGYDMITDTFISNDGDARDSDATDVGDWVTNADLSKAECKGGSVSDSSWHGSQTAGIIAAATDNGVGMAGTGRDVMILPVRVLGKCGGYDSDIIAGMRWAAGLNVPGVPLNTAHKARVLNLSLGGADGTSGGTGCADYGYDAAITEIAGVSPSVSIVAAAGNESLAVDIPAKCTGVIAVAGIRSAGTKVGFSNLGPQVAISAPGGNCVNTSSTDPCLYPILSTSNTGTTTAVSPTYTSSFGEVSLGTSFSAPQVAGTIALMLSANPSLTRAQVLSALQSTARPFPTSGGSPGIVACTAPSGTTTQDECYCTTATCGAGMLDARAAVASAVGQTGAEVDVQISSSTPPIGGTVTLDGSSATASPGASIATYQWSIVSGGASASFTSATDGPVATLLASAQGQVTVLLTVTDTAGKVGKSFRTLQVGAVPTAVINGPSTVTAGQLATFTSSGSTATLSHAIVSYQWTLAPGDTAAVLSGATNLSSVNVEGVAAGTVTLTLTVTDSAGATGSTSVGVTVAPGASGGGGGGGGGGFGLAACASLLLAIAALRRPRRQRARAARGR